MYSGIDGFLGTRASLMLDIVFLAMFAVLPAIGWSIYQVRCHQRYALHKKLQLWVAAILLVTVAAFEADMRLNGWQDRATPSPYFQGGAVGNWVGIVLGVHLIFATSTALLWVLVVVQALRRFPNPPTKNAHSASHKFWGWLAAIDMACTAITGWVFYWLAFVAT